MAVIVVRASIIISLLLHGAICNILLQFNVLSLTNNVIIRTLVLAVAAAACELLELRAITFLPDTSAAIDNDTAQEITAVMTMLVELRYETGILPVSFMGPAENRVYTTEVPIHF